MGSGVPGPARPALSLAAVELGDVERSPVSTRNRPWGDSGESARQKGPCAPPWFPSVLPLASDSRGAPSSLYRCWFWGESQHAVREAAGPQNWQAPLGGCELRQALSQGHHELGRRVPSARHRRSLGVWQRLVVPGGHCP